MDKKFGFCILGTGMIANTVANTFKKSDCLFIASVWNRTYEKAVKFSKKYKTKAYTNLEDAIMDKNVDAIYVALNHHVHYEYLKKIIKYHKPIICEKPFTLNSKETKEIIDLAKKEGTFISEAMWTLHNEPAWIVKDWLNKIGNIKSVDIIYSNPFMYILPLKRLKDINLGGGALLDSAVYPISYAHFLFGYPKDIKCTMTKAWKEVDASEIIILTYDKFIVNIKCSLVSNLKELVTINGENGKIVVPDFHFGPKAKLILNNEKIEFVSKTKGYHNELIHTKEDYQIGLKESSYVSMNDTLNVMKIMDECRKQMNLIYPSELK